MTNAQPLTMPLIGDPASAISKARLWAGRILTGFTAAFFLFDAGMKLLKPAFVVQATVQAGYPESTIAGMGAALLVSTLLYLFRRTSVLGAILLTGYLGGAVATNVRADVSAINIVAPAIFGAVAWAGLCLRESRLVEFLPLNSRA